MSTEQTWQTESTSLDATLALAAGVGARLKGSEVIELISDLGGGKTAFVRGLAQGAGSKDGVRSPSFTLSNQYQAGDLTIHHFDFYRLQEPGIMREELAELLTDPQAVVVIEWAEIVYDILPTERVTINIRATGENDRQLTAHFPETKRYLFNETA